MPVKIVCEVTKRGAKVLAGGGDVLSFWCLRGGTTKQSIQLVKHYSAYQIASSVATLFPRKNRNTFGFLLFEF